LCPNLGKGGALDRVKTERERLRRQIRTMMERSPTVFPRRGQDMDGGVTGVGFWDEIHGQTGVAPNGIELHPVLRFKGACRRV